MCSTPKACKASTAALTITAEGIASNSPMAVQAVKRFVATGAAEQAEAREPFEQALGDAVRASPDFVEGVAAFRERRQPSYE